MNYIIKVMQHKMKLKVQMIYNGQHQKNWKQECNSVQQLMSADERIKNCTLKQQL